MNFWDLITYGARALDYGARAVEAVNTTSSLCEKYDRAFKKGETFSTAEKVETVAEAAFAAIGIAALGTEAGSTLRLFPKDMAKQIHTAKAVLWTAHGISSATKKACTVWKEYNPKDKQAWVKSTTQIVDIALQIACEALLYKYRLHNTATTPLTDEQLTVVQKLSGISQVAKTGLCERLTRFLIWSKERCSSQPKKAERRADTTPASASASNVHTLSSLPTPKSSQTSDRSKIHTLASLRAKEADDLAKATSKLDPIAMALEGFSEEDQTNLRDLISELKPASLAVLCREFDRQIPDAFKDVEFFQNFIDPINGRPIRFPAGFTDSASIYEEQTLKDWIKLNPGKQVPGDHKPLRVLKEVKINTPLLELISEECRKIKLSFGKAGMLLQEVQGT